MRSTSWFLYRNIFDINIETFDRKPWRYHGVDITDFFNFGLQEESWKQYCNHMDEFRQQSTMLTKIPVFQSQKPYAVFEAECRHLAGAEKDMAKEMEQGKLVSRVFKSANTKPEGRAIQVEGSICERRPSMDLRRLQNRDSDVVIQIPVPSSTKNSSKENSGYVDNSTVMVSGSEDSDEYLDRYSRRFYASSIEDTEANSLTRCPRRKTKCHAPNLGPISQGNDSNTEGYHCQKAKKHLFQENIEAIDRYKGTKGGGGDNSPFGLGAESPVGDDQVQYSSSPSFIDSPPSIATEGNIDIDEVKRPGKRISSNSVTGIRESITSLSYHSKDFGKNGTEIDPRYSENDSGNGSMIQREHKYSSRGRVRSVSKQKIHADYGQTTRYRKEYNLVRSHGKRRERQSDFSAGEDLSFCKETKISIGYCSGRFAEKRIRGACTKVLHGESYPNFRVEMDPDLRRHWDERDYYLHKRVTARDNIVEQGHHYHYEKELSDEGGMTFEESSQPPFFTEKERFWQKRRGDENQFKKEIEDDNFVIQQRYREEQGRHVPYYMRERDYIEKKYENHQSDNGRDVKSSSRRGRYDSGPLLNMIDYSFRFGGHGDECWRSPDHDYSDREPYAPFRRKWCDTPPLRNDVYDSWRQGRRDGIKWRPMHSEEHKNSGIVDPRFEEDHDDEESIYPNDYTSRQQDGGRTYADSWRSVRRDGNKWRQMHSEEHRNSGSVIPRFKNDRNAEESIYSDGYTSRHPDQGRKYADSWSLGRKYGSKWKRMHSEEHRNSGFIDPRLKDDYDTDIYPDDYPSRHPDRGRTYAEEASISYERISKHESFHVKHDLSLGGILQEESEFHRIRRRLTEEGRNSEVIRSTLDDFDNDEDEQAVQRCRDLHMVDCKKKSFRRCDEVGDAMCNSWKYKSGTVSNNEKKTACMHLISSPKISKDEHFYLRKSKFATVGQCDLENSTEMRKETLADKYQSIQHNDSSELEEGQLKLEETPERNPGSEKIASTGGDMNERKMHSEDLVNKARILESLAKMEKRRERFKKPIALKAPDNNHCSAPEPPLDDHVLANAVEITRQRPARKRRWGGS
ncbi:hypothetical protein GIB67_001303 [Kingdonia uniflora]|uniref:Pre-mRNA polyadenylation factor Fip1 domain-containing protein n=1 Tax=Kingdonia uniflora TaxID=39325 RepID=A0A7J7LLB2_9MAGN|nr:hypothetical protein GIB67_001303 [Kingdonia uniflora]